MQQKSTLFLIGLCVILFAIVSGLMWFSNKGISWIPGSLPVACTMEAKICPDGSAVGRTGPQCEFAACPGESMTTGDLTLGTGEKGSVGTLSLTFNELVQDSRCPVDVVCIEAGAVNTNVTLTSGSETETLNVPSDEVPHQFGGYAISITKIAPDRKSRVEIPQSAYRVTFHIEKVQ